MYSAEWFETFASNSESGALEAAAIATRCPLPEFTRLLEIGCGSGRVSGPLSQAGYDVVGIDINAGALQEAAQRAPGPQYITLDQRRVRDLPMKFDCAIVLWNSIGFTTKLDDEITLSGVASVLRPGGKLLIDLYHPEWLLNQTTAIVTTNGTSVKRWVEKGRCLHIITYPNGITDNIQFNVYTPQEMRQMAAALGFECVSEMTWWNTERPPSGVCARYQLEFVLAQSAVSETSFMPHPQAPSQC